MTYYLTGRLVERSERTLVIIGRFFLTKIPVGETSKRGERGKTVIALDYFMG